MAKRSPTDYSAPRGTVSPVARPVDTFVAPVAPANYGQPDPNNQLVQLGRALSGLSPKLAALASVHPKQNDEAIKLQLAQGQAMVNANLAKNRGYLKDLSKQSELYAGMNPWQVQGAKQQALRLLANDFDTDLRAAYVAGNGANLDNIDTIVQEVQKQYQPLLDTYDVRDVAEHFNTATTTALNNLYGKHTEDRSAAVIEQIKVNTGREIQQNFEKVYKTTDQLRLDAIKAGVKDPQAIAAWSAQQQVTRNAALSTQITKMLREPAANGYPMAKLHATVAGAVIDLANARKDPTILDVLSDVETSPGSKLGGIPDIAAKIVEARDKINQAAMYEEFNRDRLASIEKDRIYSDVMDQMTTDLLNGQLKPKTDYLRLLGHTAAGRAGSLSGTYDTLTKVPLEAPSTRAKVEKVENYKADARNGKLNQQALQDDFKSGRISATDYQAIRSQESAGKSSNILKDPLYKSKASDGLKINAGIYTKVELAKPTISSLERKAHAELEKYALQQKLDMDNPDDIDKLDAKMAQIQAKYQAQFDASPLASLASSSKPAPVKPAAAKPAPAKPKTPAAKPKTPAAKPKTPAAKPKPKAPTIDPGAFLQNILKPR